MITIYHNNKCRKSRAGLEYLRSKGVEFEIREYIRDGISAQELKGVISKLGIKPFDLVRTQEEYYKENYRDESLSDDEWIEVMAGYPRLIRRPIVVTESKAVLADPPEKMDALVF